MWNVSANTSFLEMGYNTENSFNLSSGSFYGPPPPGGGYYVNSLGLPQIDLVVQKLPKLQFIYDLFQTIGNYIIESKDYLSTQFHFPEKTVKLDKRDYMSLPADQVHSTNIVAFPLTLVDACDAASQNNLALLQQCRARGINLDELTPPTWMVDSTANFFTRHLESCILQARTDHMNPIHAAALSGSLEVFNYLVDQEVDVGARTLGQGLWTDLASAFAGTLSFFSPALFFSPGLNTPYLTPINALSSTVISWFRPYNFTCAHLAAKGGHLNILKRLYDLGQIELLKKTDFYGRTIAHYGTAEIWDWINSKTELRPLLEIKDYYKQGCRRGYSMRIPYLRDRDGVFYLGEEDIDNPWVHPHFDPDPE